MENILNEDLINTLRLIKYDRSRTLLENNLLTEQGVWDSTNGDNKYWITLFNRLTSLGINVKYGSNGKQVTDPKTSTFMYWGKWIIWKDLNKGNGWPIQFQSATNWFFKFKNKKYKGESLDKSEIISYNPKVSIKLSDVIKLNDLNKDYSKIVGFCQQLKEMQLIGGIDVVKAKEQSEKYPDCFKKDNMKPIPKDSPLYKEANNWKIDPKTGELTNKNQKKPQYDYGVDMGAFINKKDISEDALLRRYKSGVLDNLYDLVYLPELGDKNYDKKVIDLKYNTRDVTIGGYKTKSSERDNPVPYGYSVFKKALANRRALKNLYGWVDEEILDITSSLLLNPDFATILQNTSPSVAIDPSYLEGVFWVVPKMQQLNNKYNIEILKKQLETSFENSERFKYGLNPRKKGEKSLKENPKITYPNGKTITITDYKDREQKYINSEVLKNFPNINQNDEELYNIEEIIRYIYDHNKQLADIKAQWFEACESEILVDVPQGRVSEEDWNKVSRNDRYGCKGPKNSDGYLVGKIKMSDVCKNKRLKGTWVIPDNIKNRSTWNFDWSTLGFTIKEVERPDSLTCACCNTNILEYQKLEVKGKLYLKCLRPNSEVSNQSSDYRYEYVKDGIVTVEPKKHMFKVEDNRYLVEKVGDYFKNCFTCTSGEGETDCHCLLDMLSIAVVVIPTVGPILSMLVDTANGMYYLVDALKADNNMDRNSALLSAGLTIFGGIMTGYGDAKALLSIEKRVPMAASYAETWLVRSQKLKTQKELDELTKVLNQEFKLTESELEVAGEYLESIQKLQKSTKAKKVIFNYQNTIKNIQSNIGLNKWRDLVGNKNFAKILIENKGNVISAIKQFNKTAVGKDLLIQIGFFAGGETLIPGLIGPWVEEKVKTGQWGSLKLQIESNKYSFEQVTEEFGISKEDDLKLLQGAWNDKKAIKVDGVYKPWRPGYTVPVKYQTTLYKKYLKEKEEELKAEKKNEETWKELHVYHKYKNIKNPSCPFCQKEKPKETPKEKPKETPKEKIESSNDYESDTDFLNNL
jgi:hypothetical protein